MGLFGKLFEKENCAFCGKELGVFGKKKLEDGVMCGDCQKKLSPWFTERKESTIAEIQQQLDYREANKEKVAAFRTTRTFGTGKNSEKLSFQGPFSHLSIIYILPHLSILYYQKAKKPIRNRNSQSASFLTPLHFYIQSPFRPGTPPTMFRPQRP